MTPADRSLSEACLLINETYPETRAEIERVARGVVRIRLSGEILDRASSQVTRLLVTAAEDSSPGDRLELDLSGLGYACSSGIGAFAQALIAAKSTKARLVVVGVSPSVLSLFELLGFASFFEFDLGSGEAR